jgi:integrase
MFKRGSVYWSQNNTTGKQKTLRTKIRNEAETLLNHMNEACRAGLLNRQIGRTYLLASNPELASRTWQEAMDAIAQTKSGSTHTRWVRAINDKALDSIRSLILTETTSDHFFTVLNSGTISTNTYLKRIHNHALGMNWLLEEIIPKRKWPEVRHKQKRAITLEEHNKIIQHERNKERRAYYELCWHFGGAQTDMASITAEQIDLPGRNLTYYRRKTKGAVQLKIGEQAAVLLESLPKSGQIFPYLNSVRANDRATEFKQRCRQLGIEGVTLHSYRYAWAQRAAVAGYPERYAQMALGHHSQAVHRAYAKKAQTTLPTLEDYENNSLKDRTLNK